MAVEREKGKGQPGAPLSAETFGMELVGWGKKSQQTTPVPAPGPVGVQGPRRKIARYGWVPDLPDQRDFTYAVPAHVAGNGGPRVDLRGACPPVYDQGHIGSCFPPGTHVRMADGTERRIDAVHPLEQVLTAEGRVGTVRTVMGRMVGEDIVKLKLWGHNYLRMTEEHPVLTRRGYVAAKDLLPSDWVAMPRYLPERQTVIQTEGHVCWRERIRATGKRHYAGVLGRGDVSVLVKPVPDFIELTPGVGRIFGLFLSEGNTDKTKVVWSFGAHEKDTLVQELVELLGNEWGVEARVQLRLNSCVKVNLYGTAWAKLFESLCSTGAGRKRLHPDLAAGPRPFMEAMLRGWLDGDGWHSERGRCGVSISHDLALSMFDIAQALGLRPTINWGKPTQSPGVRERQPRWTVEMCSQSDNWRVEQNGTHVWRKVRALERESYDGPVYNLSVEGDESYVAEGVGVHNCTANAIAAAVEFDMRKQGLNAFTPSRLFIYYNERAIEGKVAFDSGAMLRDGIKSVARWGDCPESLWPYEDVMADSEGRFPPGARAATRPPQRCYDEAVKHQALNYRSVTQNLADMKGCLAEGFPFVFGFTVYESFESDEVRRTGIVPMPQQGEAPQGGHAVLAVGYDDASCLFIVRNSWGPGWGAAGYFFMPYAYLLDDNLATDFWTIRLVR